MKKIITLVFSLIMTLPAISISAQDMGLLREQTIKKYDIKKSSKKEAKQLQKEGWKSFGGSGLLEDQIFERMVLDRMRNEDGEKIYIVETQTFTTDDPGAAIKFARERAVQALAAAIGQNVVDAIAVNVGTDKVTGRTINEAKANAMSVVEQKMKNVEPVVKMISCPKSKPGFYMASVTVSYNREKAEKLAAESVIRNTELEDPTLKKAVLEAMGRLQGTDGTTHSETE